MGKTGALLRMRKDETKTITFTQGQLKQHDAAVAQAAIKQRSRELEEEAERQVRAQIGDMIPDKFDEFFYNTFQYLAAVSVRVLVEHFGWSPITNSNSKTGDDKRYRIVQFVHYLEDEIIRIQKTGDIKGYAKEVAEKYGIGFIAEDAD